MSKVTQLDSEELGLELRFVYIGQEFLLLKMTEKEQGWSQPEPQDLGPGHLSRHLPVQTQ